MGINQDGIERLARRAEIERSSPLLLALDRLQSMLLRVEWVRQASGNKYACAFCGGVSERDGGTGHADDCEFILVTHADYVAESQPKDDRAMSARWQELFWALPSGPMRSALRSLEIDVGRALREKDRDERQLGR